MFPLVYVAIGALSLVSGKIGRLSTFPLLILLALFQTAQSLNVFNLWRVELAENGAVDEPESLMTLDLCEWLDRQPQHRVFSLIPNLQAKYFEYYSRKKIEHADLFYPPWEISGTGESHWNNLFKHKDTLYIRGKTIPAFAPDKPRGADIKILAEIDAFNQLRSAVSKTRHRLHLVKTFPRPNGHLAFEIYEVLPEKN